MVCVQDCVPIGQTLMGSNESVLACHTHDGPLVQAGAHLFDQMDGQAPDPGCIRT